MKACQAAVVAFAALMPLPLQAEAPPGWAIHSPTSQAYQSTVTDTDAVEGRYCLVLASDHAQPHEFGTLMQVAAATPFQGTRIRLSAKIKTESAQSAWLWLRADRADGRSVAFDNMHDRPVVGTANWSEQSIVLEIPHDAEALAFGVGLSGTGKVYADAFAIEPVSGDVPATAESRLGVMKGPVNSSLIKPKAENLGFEAGANRL